MISNSDTNYMYFLQNFCMAAFFFVSLQSCQTGHKPDVVIPERKDSFFILVNQLKQEENNMEVYVEGLKTLDNYLVENKLQDSLYNTEFLYQIIPQDREDSLSMRLQLTRHAQHFNKLNDYREALKYYLKASALVEDLSSDKYVWNIENRIGGIYARMDDYDKALYYYRLCIPSLTIHQNYSNLSRLYKEIGRANMWLGRYEEMKHHFDEGISMGTAAREYRALQAIHEAYADYYIHYDTDTGRINNAVLHLRHSEAFLDSLPLNEDRLDREHSLDALWGAYFQLCGLYSLSEYHYCESLHNAQQIYRGPKSREIAKIYNQLAQLSLIQNIPETCNDYVQKGIGKLIRGYGQKELPELYEIDRENTFVDLLRIKAEYYFLRFVQNHERNLLDSALTAIDLAINANDQLNKKLMLNNSRYISVGTNKNLVNKGIDYCYDGYTNLKDDIYLQAARKYFDQSKSILYSENLFRLSVRASMSEKDKMIYDSLKSGISVLIEKLETSNENKNLELQINAENERLEKLIKKYSPASHTTSHPIQSPYLEYVEAEKDYYLFSNIKGKRFIRIGDKILLNDLLNSFHKGINSRDEQSISRTLDSLSTLLLPENLSGIQKLIIIPDGHLSYLPFDLLIKNGQYLLENHEVHVLFHNKQPDFRQKKNNDPLIYILNPEYKHPEIPSYASAERGELSYLPFAAHEVSQLQTHFTQNDIVAVSPAAEELENQLKKSDIFHFTGHALVQGDRAYLALTDTGQNIIPLYDNEIYRMTNQLELVTLSACETGVGSIKKGEGVKSLASAFLNSGAQSIVYSLWKADDQSAADIMAFFYRHLFEGADKDKALQLAKKDFLRKCSPHQRHPYYWAAFVIAGNTDPITQPNTKIVLYGLAGILLCAGIYLFYHYKTKNL